MLGRRAVAERRDRRGQDVVGGGVRPPAFVDDGQPFPAPGSSTGRAAARGGRSARLDRASPASAAVRRRSCPACTKTAEPFGVLGEGRVRPAPGGEIGDRRRAATRPAPAPRRLRGGRRGRTPRRCKRPRAGEPLVPGPQPPQDVECGTRAGPHPVRPRPASRPRRAFGTGPPALADAAMAAAARINAATRPAVADDPVGRPLARRAGCGRASAAGGPGTAGGRRPGRRRRGSGRRGRRPGTARRSRRGRGGRAG